MRITPDNTPCRHPEKSTSDVSPRHLLLRIPCRARLLARRFREFNAAQVEARERLWLRERPWEEELLHWSRDGELHGHLVPPRGRHSVTGSGWCLRGS